MIWVASMKYESRWWTLNIIVVAYESKIYIHFNCFKIMIVILNFDYQEEVKVAVWRLWVPLLINVPIAASC